MIMCFIFFLIWPILEAKAEILKKFRLLFVRFVGTKLSFWNQLTFKSVYICLTNNLKKNGSSKNIKVESQLICSKYNKLEIETPKLDANPLSGRY